MNDFKLGWHLFCDGKEIDDCANEAQRRGWAAAFTDSEVGTM